MTPLLWLRVADATDDIGRVLVEQSIGQYTRDGGARWSNWAPGGDLIAFDTIINSPDRRIRFLRAVGGGLFGAEIPGEQADWSPDGRQLVYRSGRDNKQGIWISNRDDSGAHPITIDGIDAFPSWSPDGLKIAFHRERDGNVDVYLMNPDGSNIQRLTDTPGPDTLPAWTPDGRIVFRSMRTGSWGIY